MYLDVRFIGFIMSSSSSQLSFFEGGMSKWTTEILHGQVQINARLDVRRNASQTKQFIPTLPGTAGDPPYPADPQIGNFFEMVWQLSDGNRKFQKKFQFPRLC